LDGQPAIRMPTLKALWKRSNCCGGRCHAGLN
jgi:hypothetical protein